MVVNYKRETDMQEESRLLIKYYLEKKGYLVSLGVPLPPDLVEIRAGRPENEIDIVAVKLSGGVQESAIVGVNRPWWESGLTLTPRLISLQLEGQKEHLSNYFSPKRMEYIMTNFGLAKEPERVLFFPRRSPTKHEEAEAILSQKGISVVYLEEVLIEIYPLLKEELRGAKSMQIKTLAAFYPIDQLRRRARDFKKARPETPDVIQLDLFEQQGG